MTTGGAQAIKDGVSGPLSYIPLTTLSKQNPAGERHRCWVRQEGTQWEKLPKSESHCGCKIPELTKTMGGYPA